jgi:hypothetical protein
MERSKLVFCHKNHKKMSTESPIGKDSSGYVQANVEVIE